MEVTRPMQAFQAAPGLAALFDRHGAEIGGAWAERLRALPGSPYQKRTPEELDSWAMSAIGQLIRSLRTGSLRPLENHAERMSRNRLEQGFAIDEVVEGMLLLKEAALPFLLDAHPEDAAAAGAAIGCLDTCLRKTIARFAALYAEGARQAVEDEARRLQQATAALLQMRGLDDVFKIVCRELRHLTGTVGSAVFLRGDGDGLRLACSSGTAQGRELELLRSAAAGDPAALNFPLHGMSEDLGILLLVTTAHGFADADRRLGRLYAEVVAIAIEHALLHERHKQLLVLEERQKLAHELHDSVTQSLYGVTMYGEAAARHLVAGNLSRATELLRELRDISLEALREMRLLIFELRPPLLEKEGLIAALRARLSAVEGRTGIKTHFAVVGVESLPRSVEEGLYGIAKEALNNVLKHARSSRITVRLREKSHANDSLLCLEIIDDGVGFEPSEVGKKGGLGLPGMEERASRLDARLTVTSRRGEGTCVRVEVPVDAAAAASDGGDS